MYIVRDLLQKIASHSEAKIRDILGKKKQRPELETWVKARPRCSALRCTSLARICVGALVDKGEGRGRCWDDGMGDDGDDGWVIGRRPETARTAAGTPH